MVKGARNHYLTKIIHIDYMLYKVGGSHMMKLREDYNRKYSESQLREVLAKKLIEFAEAPKHRNIKIKKYPTGKKNDLSIIPTYIYLYHRRYEAVGKSKIGYEQI